ncbi:MAG: hypothetical protein WDM91_10925 [Rhizomicrobium sp.]
MLPIVTIIEKADNRLLVALDTVKNELGIADGSSDTLLDTFRARASQAIVGYCRREFARDLVEEKHRGVRRAEVLVLASGFPDPSRATGFCSITSVMEGETALTPDDYEVDQGAGLLYRLSQGRRSLWRCHEVTVRHRTGYVLPDDDDDETLPEQVQGAAVQLVKAARFGAQRDPALRSESVLNGLYSYTLFDSVLAGSDVLPSVASPLERYRNVGFV